MRTAPTLLLSLSLLLTGCLAPGQLSPGAQTVLGDISAGAPFICTVVDAAEPWCKAIESIVAGVIGGAQALGGRVGAAAGLRYVALVVPGEVRAFGLLDARLWSDDVERRIVAGLLAERARVKGARR